MPALIRCPVCRVRMRGDEQLDEPCPRCSSDLSLVRRAFLQARHHQHRARMALAGRDGRAAEAHARAALRSVDLPEIRRTLCAALLARGRPAAAVAICTT